VRLSYGSAPEERIVSLEVPPLFGSRLDALEAALTPFEDSLTSDDRRR